MIKRALILVLCLMSYLLTAAALPDLADYRDLSKSLGNPIIFNESFDPPMNPEIWIQVPATFQQVAGQGYNGTGALFHERLHPEDRQQIMRGNVKLEHGVEYRCSFKLKNEDYHTPDNNNQDGFKNVLSMVNVIYRKNGKWSAISSSFSKHRELPPPGNGKVSRICGFTVPPTVEHLKEWKAGGFNSLMYHHPIKYLYIDGKKPTQAENILSSLDLMEKHEIKMIFSLFYQHMLKPHSNRKECDQVRGLNNVTEHVVNLAKNHSAMLAYYRSDENFLE